MTAPTISMLAPSATAFASFQAQSGTSYTADAYGVISGVPVTDVLSLRSSDCIPLGLSGGLSKFNGTAAPASTNDTTQDFAIGSHWLDTTHGTEYVATSVAKNSAVWIGNVTSANFASTVAALTSAQALTSFAAVSTAAAISASAYGFTSAQANGIIALLNALRAVAIQEGVVGP